MIFDFKFKTKFKLKSDKKWLLADLFWKKGRGMVLVWIFFEKKTRQTTALHNWRPGRHDRACVLRLRRA